MKVATGTFAIGTGAAASTVDVTGLGFNPTAGQAVVLFSWGGRTDASQSEQHHKFGMGYGVSTTDRGGATSQAEHDSASGDADCQVYDDACIKLLTIAGAVDGAADFSAWITDGFRLVIDDQFAASYLIHWMVIEGLDDVESQTVTVPGTTGSSDITSYSFQPDCVLLFGASSDAINTVGIHSRFSIGAVCGTGVTNYVLAGFSQNGAATSVTTTYCRSGEAYAVIAAGDAVAIRASITAWLSNGFTLNVAETSGSTPVVRGLALKSTGLAVGDILTQTGTTNASETGVGFKPAGLLLASHNKAASTADAGDPHDERSVGFAVSSSAQNFVNIVDVDASGTMNIGVAQNTTGMYGNQDTASAIAVEGVMGLVTMDSDGFTFAHSDADPSQAFAWYLAVQEDAVGGLSIPIAAYHYAHHLGA